MEVALIVGSILVVFVGITLFVNVLLQPGTVPGPEANITVTNESNNVLDNNTYVTLGTNFPSTYVTGSLRTISIRNVTAVIPPEEYNLTGSSVGIMFNGSYRSQ